MKVQGPRAPQKQKSRNLNQLQCDVHRRKAASFNQSFLNSPTQKTAGSSFTQYLNNLPNTTASFNANATNIGKQNG